MRFEDAYEGWTEKRLTQIDKRLAQLSHRRAPVDEVMRRVDRYRNGVVPEPAEGMTRPTSTTRCSSVIRKAHRAACGVYGR